MSSLATLALNPSALRTPLPSQLAAAPKANNKGLAQAAFAGLGVTFNNTAKPKFGLSDVQMKPSQPPVDTLEIARGLNYLASELMRARINPSSAFAGSQQANSKALLSSELTPAKSLLGAQAQTQEASGRFAISA
ncbi:MAG: hypothetical protein KC476_01535 [Cyanobacteria bacterium HKST-UBA06]|nr:hypothetical protein [Cyanobacteria bacterium HKST-UBA05]MCA9806613.1 hypothetical protein [Cyanobacteria bacterium HKST-UBA06]